MPFQRAAKKDLWLRLALAGPAGSGKTYTALTLATFLAEEGTVALVDTEHGSANRYADRFAFDQMNLTNHHPQRYIEAIQEAQRAGYRVLILDSISHAWMGEDGALELVGKKAGPKDNTFAAWRQVTPLHRDFIDAMLGCQMHLIATLRSKMEYALEKDERTGKTAPKKLGMAAIQREGIEYEFDIVGELDNATLTITKTRCPELAGQVLHHPAKELALLLLDFAGRPVAVTPVAHAVASSAPASEQDKFVQSVMALADKQHKHVGLWRLAHERGLVAYNSINFQWHLLEKREDKVAFYQLLQLIHADDYRDGALVNMAYMVELIKQEPDADKGWLSAFVADHNTDTEDLAVLFQGEAVLYDYVTGHRDEQTIVPNYLL